MWRSGVAVGRQMEDDPADGDDHVDAPLEPSIAQGDLSSTRETSLPGRSARSVAVNGWQPAALPPFLTRPWGILRPRLHVADAGAGGGRRGSFDPLTSSRGGWLSGGATSERDGLHSTGRPVGLRGDRRELLGRCRVQAYLTRATFSRNVTRRQSGTIVLRWVRSLLAHTRTGPNWSDDVPRPDPRAASG